MDIPKIDIFELMRKFLRKNMGHPSKYLGKPSYFTHNGKLSFEVVFTTILSKISRSLSIELYTISASSPKVMPAVTASAFCQARQKIHAILFIDFFQYLVKYFYNSATGIQCLSTWNGYYLLAVDGSKLSLPNTAALREKYGTQGNQHGKYPLGNVHARYDVLNGFLHEISLNPYKSSERTNALVNIDKLPKKSVNIYDRGYASADFIYQHVYHHLKYVLRLKLGFNNVVKDFVASGKKDAVVNFTLKSRHKKKLAAYDIAIQKDDTFQVRLVRIELPTGKSEVLATNLWQSAKVSLEDLNKLYALRWGIETYFDRFKNLYQGAQFSSRSVNGVEQEFYATAILSFINNFLIKSCASKLKRINDRRTKKYQINHNIALGLLKQFMFPLVFSNKRDDLVEALQHLMVANLVLKEKKPYKPGKRPAKTNTKHTNRRYGSYGNHARTI